MCEVRYLASGVGSSEVRYLASGGGVRSLNNCLYTFGLYYYKTIKKREILRISWVWRVCFLHETGQTGRYLHGFVQI